MFVFSEVLESTLDVSTTLLLVGLLCGRLLLHNGHRRGVVMNMTLRDFAVSKIT